MPPRKRIAKEVEDESGTSPEAQDSMDLYPSQATPKRRGRPPKRAKLEDSNDEDEDYFRSLSLEADEMDEDEEEEEEPDGGRKLKTNFEAGVIRSIYAENFMCHRKFQVKLGPGLNFVVGANGSGKSAVVSAIQLCLGATARSTGRGSSLGKFVREGSNDPALVRVTLLNTGPDAYQPEVYGDRIVIERKFTRTGGGGGYSIKGARGKEISSQKSDLEKILRTFNIFVDNPCCVLTQDESKRFVQGKDSEKYDFFLKATGLFNLREELKEVNNNAEKTENLVEDYRKKLEDKARGLQQLKAKYDRLRHLDTLQDKINLCRGKLIWLDVVECQERVRAIDAALDKSEAEVQKLQNDLDTYSGNDQSHVEEMKELEEEIASIQQQQEAIAEESNQKQAVYLAASRKFEGLKVNLSNQDKRRSEYSIRLTRAQKEVKELQDKARAAAKDEEREIIDRIDHLNSGIVEVQQEEERLRQERLELQKNVLRLQNQQTSLDREEQQVIREIDRAKQEYSQVSSSSSRVAVFGADMVSFCAEIARESFRGPVVGPVGTCVALKEGMEEWSQALERTLGPLLRAFIVTDADDRDRLSALAARRNLRNLTIVTQPGHERYRVQGISGGEGSVLLALGCLNVEHDIVFNCLVDQLNIDRVALGKNEDAILQNYVEGQGRSQRLRYGLTSAIDARGNVIKYLNGNQSSEANRFPFLNVLAKSSVEVLASIQQSIGEKERQVVSLRNQKLGVAGEVSSGRKKLDSMDSQLSRITKEISKLQRDKREAETKLAEQQDASRIDTTALEQEISELKSSIETVSNQMDLLQVEINDSKQEMEEKLKEKRRVEAERGQLVDQAKQQEKRIEEIMRRRRLAERKLSDIKKRVDDKKQEASRYQTQLAKAHEDLNTRTEYAMEETKKLIADWDEEPLDIDDHETRAFLDKKSKELKAELIQGQNDAGLRGESVEMVKKRYEKAKNDFEKAQRVMEEVEKNLDSLQSDKEQRRKKWLGALRANTKSTKEKFDNYVQAKGAAGTVEFNHKEHSLTVQFQVDNADQTSIRNDVRNLSGGERSFVTFSLLLALGHVIESPFRLMDEYDVYMDEPTRKLTLDLLQEYSKQADQRGRQFIILTPHKLGDLRPSNMLRIFQMAEPVRQSANGPQQQTLPFTEDA
eukprot:gene1809-1976_t